MCGGSGIKIGKDIGRIGLNPFDFKAHQRLFSEPMKMFKDVSKALGLSQDAPEINIPESKGVATENMSSGNTGALVELGATDYSQRTSGKGSGSRSRSGLSGLGGSGLGF